MNNGTNKSYIDVYVDKLYANCPKPDGWTGFVYTLSGSSRSGHAIFPSSRINIRPLSYLRLYGYYECKYYNNKRFREFCVERAEFLYDYNHMINYLVKYIPKVTRKKAISLCNYYGSNILKLTPDDIDNVMATFKLSEISATRLCYEFLFDYEVYKVVSALGVTYDDAEKLIDFYVRYDYKNVDEMIESIIKNPYTILKKQYDFNVNLFSIPFVDKIALYLNFDLSDPLRILFCIDYTLEKCLQNKGHHCLKFCNDASVSDWNYFSNSIRDFNGLSDLRDSYIVDVINNNHLMFYLCAYDDSHYLYSTKTFFCECSSSSVIRNHVGGDINFSLSALDNLRREIIDNIIEYQDQVGMMFDLEQINGIMNCFLNKVSVLTGGPGCGKTQVMDCVCWIWNKLVGHKIIALAPTGLASRNLTTSLDFSNNDRLSKQYDAITAQTLASFIYGSFKKRDDNKYEYYSDTLFIVDEMSMVTLFDFNSLCKSFDSSSDCHILFVGDTDQLPCIGSGNVLFDLCNIPAIPITKLVNNYRIDRSSRCILDNVDMIKSGHVDDFICKDNVFSVIPFIHEAENMLDAIVSKYVDYVNFYGFSDVALLAPMQRNICGVKSLNIKIQSVLNPLVILPPTHLINKLTINLPYYDNNNKIVDYIAVATKGVEIPSLRYDKTLLRIGDRVMCTHNMNSCDCFVANGDMGFITGFSYVFDKLKGKYDLYVDVKFDLIDKTISFPFLDASSYLSLCYAMTIHKSQGCGFKAVVLVAQSIMLSPLSDFVTRNLLYTGVTRAKREICIIGNIEGVKRCVHNEVKPRHSLFIDRYERLL